MSLLPEGAAVADAWIIEPQRTGIIARAAEFWRYRRVLWFLASRAVTDRYKGTTLGIFWLFARPMIPVLITAVVFGGFLSIPSDGVPFVLFFMTGIIPWNLFDRSIMFGTKALEQHRGLIKKLYFPRLIAPCASVAPAVVDGLIYVALLAGAALFYWWKDGVFYVKIGPFLPVALAMAFLSFCAAMGVVLWTCVFQTRYRDVRFSLRYVLQFWMYMTPIFYPLSLVRAEYRWLLYLNPLGPIVATFRWAVLGVGEVPMGPLISASVIVMLSVVVGLWFFTTYESSTMDRL